MFVLLGIHANLMTRSPFKTHYTCAALIKEAEIRIEVLNSVFQRFNIIFNAHVLKRAVRGINNNKISTVLYYCVKPICGVSVHGEPALLACIARA